MHARWCQSRQCFVFVQWLFVYFILRFIIFQVVWIKCQLTRVQGAERERKKERERRRKTGGKKGQGKETHANNRRNSRTKKGTSGCTLHDMTQIYSYQNWRKIQKNMEKKFCFIPANSKRMRVYRIKLLSITAWFCIAIEICCTSSF